MDQAAGGARTISAASGGLVLAFNTIGTAPTSILNAYAQRTSITFHNPGTVTVYVAPAVVQNTGSDVALSPSPTALGGCFALAPGSYLTLSGEVQKAWQAFAASGTTNPLTVMPTSV